MRIKCETCKKMKHDTAFGFKQYKWYQFWENWLELDTSICLDCKYPHRWDEAREYFNEYLKKWEY